MILHLGEDTIVFKKDVVAIFDMQSAVNPVTQDFLQTAMIQGNVRMVGKEDYKSIILCKREKQTLVYYSPISAKTLRARGI